MTGAFEGPHDGQGRPPFQQLDIFMSNAFQRRFQGILKWAWDNGTWHAVAALPGSGKSTGVRELVRAAGGYKTTGGKLSLPVLDVLAPQSAHSQIALGAAIAAGFGRVPAMPWHRLRAWLVEQLITLDVGLLIVDDAHELSDVQFALIRDLTDQVVRHRNGAGIGLCLVCASFGSDVPIASKLFAHPEQLAWAQFIRRMHRTYTLLLVNNHSADELVEICRSFEHLYQPQLPKLSLTQWTYPLYEWLTSPLLDPGRTQRVTMDNINNCLLESMRLAYDQGLDNVTSDILRYVTSRMSVRRDEPVVVDAETEGHFNVHVVNDAQWPPSEQTEQDQVGTD